MRSQLSAVSRKATVTAHGGRRQACRRAHGRLAANYSGRRDELITLFEREFIETHEAVGLHVLGIVRDARRPERFVWLRGFADMASRARGLAAFYDGPVWGAHREAANALMIDPSDVLLLRPVSAPPSPSDAYPSVPWQVVVCPLAAPPHAALLEALRASGSAWLETEPAENGYPRLPVRSGKTVVVGLARGNVDLPQALHGCLIGDPQVL